MELFELKEAVSETQAELDYYTEEHERLMTRVLPKAGDTSKEFVRGGGSSRENVLIKLTQMSMNVDEAKAKLDNLIKLRDKKYNIYQKANDYDKQIYMEKRLLKWSNNKISAKHNGLSRMQIWRIINKFENMKQNVTSNDR